MNKVWMVIIPSYLFAFWKINRDIIKGIRMKTGLMKRFQNYGLALLGMLILSSCGGGGSCGDCTTNPTPTPTPTPGTLSLTLTAPNQYPAGVAVTAYLTMTNTSKVNANNLVYAVPDATNYTGATITVPNGASNPCLNIAAGASCTFPANISANSHPGSFTVTATPDSSSSFASKLHSLLNLKADSLSLTANIGLSTIAANSEAGANGITFLYSNTIAVSSSGETLISIVGYVNSASAGSFNTLNLTNQNGDLLDFQVQSGNSGTGLTDLTQGSIVTYLLKIPAGSSGVYNFYAQTMKDGVLVNQGTVANPINLSAATSGVLVVQPTNFNLSADANYESQIVTYTNTGQGNVTGLSFGSAQSPISVTTNNCGTTLSAGQSCTVVLSSNAAAGTSGTGSFVANYNNGSSEATAVSQYNYSGHAPISGISLSAVNNFVFEANTVSSSSSTQVTLTNTGNVMESNFVFSFSPAQYFSVSAGTGENPCRLSGSTVTTELIKSQSCSITLTYNNPTVSSSTTTMDVNYNYNGSLSGSSSKTLSYSTTQASANFSVSPASPYTFPAIAANNLASESVVFTYTNNGPDVASGITVGPLTGFDPGYYSVINTSSASDCSGDRALAVGDTCTVTVQFGPTTTPRNNATATLPLSITSATGGSSTIETTLLGTSLTPGMAFLTAVNDTANDPMSFGFLNTTSPYWLNPNTNGILKFTVTNTGTGAATNLIYRMPSMGFCPLDPKNTTCGNDVEGTRTGLAVNASCIVQFICDEASGSMNVGSMGVFTYNDESRATVLVRQIPTITPFDVNIVVPATVSATLSSESDGSVAITSVNAESTFYVVYKLSNGYNVQNQTYGLDLSNAQGGTPPISVVSSSTCTVSSNNPVCNIKLNAGGAAESQKIIYTTTGNIAPQPADSGYFNVVGSKFWTLITGGLGQPAHIRDVYGSPTPQSIVVSADNPPSDYSRYLWVYVNGSWTQLCNGENGTPGAGQVLFNTSPTPTDILWYTNGNELWSYKDGNWSKLLGAEATVNTPSGATFGGVVGNSNSSFIVGTDFDGYQLWMYNNKTWTKLTGGVNQPVNAYMLSKASAQPNSITIYDGSGNIWFYNGTTWNKVGDGTTPPNPYANTMGGTFYGDSTSTSILFTPGPNARNSLWVYNGSSWTQVSGTTLSGTPLDVSAIFGAPSNNSLISRDGNLACNPNCDNYSIWTYVSGAWTNMTTGNGETSPQYGWLVYGTNAVPSQFFMSDLQDSTKANLWEWHGNSWSKKTGSANGPTSVSFVGGNPTHDSFVMMDGTIKIPDYSNTQVWTYVNGSWTNITGHADEPAGVNGLYGMVNPNSIVATHYISKMLGSDLWIGKR